MSYQNLEASITSSFSSSLAFSRLFASPPLLRAREAKCARAISHCPSDTALKMADSSFCGVSVQRRTFLCAITPSARSPLLPGLSSVQLPRLPDVFWRSKGKSKWVWLGGCGYVRLENGGANGQKKKHGALPSRNRFRQPER